MKYFLHIVLFVGLLTPATLFAEAYEGLLVDTITVTITPEKAEAALRTAKFRGLVLGYSSSHQNLKQGTIEMSLIDDSRYDGTYLFIKVKVLPGGELRIKGYDMTFSSDAVRLRSDMKKIVKAIKECCGVR